MAYPRRCPLCDADYGGAGAADQQHVTVATEPGGTPSPWRPREPGALLTLACSACRGEYRWDYFADAGRRPVTRGQTHLRWLGA